MTGGRKEGRTELVTDGELYTDRQAEMYVCSGGGGGLVRNGRTYRQRQKRRRQK